MSLNSTGSETAATPASRDEPKRAVRHDRPKPRSARLTGRKTTCDFTIFENWLSDLGMLANPTIHINGVQHPGCIMLVDFGTPLRQPKLSPDQSSELASRLRRAAGELAMTDPRCRKAAEASGRDVSIRVCSDSSNGIYWATMG